MPIKDLKLGTYEFDEHRNGPVKTKYIKGSSEEVAERIKEAIRDRFNGTDKRSVERRKRAREKVLMELKVKDWTEG